MASGTPPSRLRVDSDGVRADPGFGVRSGVWLLALAVLLVGIAALLLVQPHMSPTSTDAVTPRLASAADSGAPDASTRAPARKPRRAVAGAAAEGSAGPPIAKPAAPPEAPAGVAAADDPEATEATGMALFPPMGSKPIKRGIVVPEGFELPPGYVRHYQATDDGELLPPILMFHPDYEFVDSKGAPVAIPADRVVPPELAPAGMPIQMLQPPDDPSTRDAGP
jgi:hypothetical protein